MEAPSTGLHPQGAHHDLVVDDHPTALKRTKSESDSSVHKEAASTKEHDHELGQVEKNEDEDYNVSQMRSEVIYQKLRPFILVGLALLILGWWISSTILEATRHRWYDY